MLASQVLEFVVFCWCLTSQPELSRPRRSFCGLKSNLFSVKISGTLLSINLHVVPKVVWVFLWKSNVYYAWRQVKFINNFRSIKVIILQAEKEHFRFSSDQLWLTWRRWAYTPRALLSAHVCARKAVCARAPLSTWLPSLSLSPPLSLSLSLSLSLLPRDLSTQQII